MKTILVVDDEPNVASVAITTLEDEGFHVVSAANGVEALKKLSEGDFDLIISDFMMPFMDGATMTRQIRENPQYQHLPILVVSAMSESVIRQRFHSYDAFLPKPYRITMLLHVVAALLERQAPGP